MQTKYDEDQMNDIYPLDIWHVIFQYCDLLSQLRLILVCSAFNHSFFITDMYDIADIYKKRVTEQILRQMKFKKIISLTVTYNYKTNDISFLTNLKKLDVSGNRTIDQEGIKGLDLIELYVNDNEKITDVSFMTNLKKLYVEGECGINQEGINGLDLVELSVNNNH